MGTNSATALIMATMLEAKPFVQGMVLKKSITRPFEVFRNDNILLIVSGIGRTNAVNATTYILEKFKPARIFNLGAAGATDSFHQLGEVFHITQIYEYDGAKFKSGKSYIHKPYMLSGFKTAQLVTSDKAILNPIQRREISSLAGLVDMEGASVAQACKMFKTKCILFKFVSDTPEHTDEKDIFKNIRRYRTPFYEFFNSAVLPIFYNRSA